MRMQLADGKEYQLSPVTLGEHRKFVADLKAATEEQKLEPSINLIHASLVKQHPELTPEIIGDKLLTFVNFGAVMDAVLTVSALKVESAPGEPSPAAN